MARKKQKVIRKTLGRTWGLNIRGAWIRMFKENATKRLSDEAISKFMQKEFPGRSSLDITTVKGVSNVRNAYNRGVFTAGKAPAVLSRRYENGKPVEGRARVRTKAVGRSHATKAGADRSLGRVRVRARSEPVGRRTAGSSAVASKKAA